MARRRYGGSEKLDRELLPVEFFLSHLFKKMGKFMQWTSAIILYFGLSLATFNRSLDPKDGTYAEKGTLDFAIELQSIPYCCATLVPASPLSVG